MTSDSGGVNRNLTATQHFLFSKTPAEERHAPERDTPPDGTEPTADEPLRKRYPKLRIGDAAIERAAEQTAGQALFTALALRIDTAAHRPGDDHAQLQQVRGLVADTVDRWCEAENGWWGLMTSDIFGCVFPGRDVASGLALAKKVQARVHTALGRTLTIGLAAFPCLKYTPREVIENARKALEHAFFLGPGGRACFDAISLNISGDRYYDAGDIDRAIGEYRNALRLDSRNVNVLNSLGVCFGVQQKYAKALTAFQTALKIKADEILALYNSGLVQLLMGEREKALQCWLKAAPSGKDVFELNLQAGKLLLESGQPEKAQELLQRAAALKPESAAVQRLLGDTYLDQRLLDQAIVPFKKTLRIHPNDAQALSGLGRCYELKNENLDIALAFCRQSVEINPDSGRFHLRLGRLLKKTGQFDKALDAFRKAQSLGEDAQAAIRAIEDRSVDKAC
ncbi:MAG: tetratricopeptide repeat protein [Desulfobacterales bacterium]|jgi:tetratricopeptide (TPR) repeat protein